MKIKILTLGIAFNLMNVTAHAVEQTEYCVTTYQMPAGHLPHKSDMREYAPMVANDFNRKTYELPTVDGEVHIKQLERYKLMAEDFGKESLYVVRHADIDNNRYTHPDIAFLAKTAKNPSVVIDKTYAMVLAKSDKPNTINIKKIPLSEHGYKGRLVWDEIVTHATVLGDLIEFEFETAITVNNKPYALIFTKAQSKNSDLYEYGAVLIDLQNPNRYRYKVLYNDSNEKSLHGNAMYVNHYGNTIMVNVFDRLFKVKG